MSSFWRPLAITTREHDLPPLLVKYDFSPASYTIHLTNLTYLWTESLDRKQIIKRALNLETSIDPSEDASQMQLLLRHVRDTLGGREGTTVAVHGEDDSDKLNLSAFVALPSPIPPLEWPIHLIRAPQAAFTTEVVVPILAQCSSAKAQVNSLLQHLKEKDQVITKLTDKMQSDGGDLGKIFPGASTGKAGSKLSGREFAAKTVKGLAEFDEKEWWRRLGSTYNTSGNIDSLLSSVFGSDSINVQEYSQPSGISPLWKRLESEKKPSSNSGSTASVQSHRLKNLPAKPSPESDVENEYKRQTTPPSLNLEAPQNNRNDVRTTSRLQSPSPENGESTTDESDGDDLSTPVQRKAPGSEHGLAMRPNGHQKSTISSSSVGSNIGKSRSRTPEAGRRSRTPCSPGDAVTSSPNQKIHSERGSFEADESSPVASEPKNPLPLPKPKHKLGKIGGRAKADSSVPDPAGRQSKEDPADRASPIENDAKELGLSRDNGAQHSKQAAAVSKPAVQPDLNSPRKVSEEQANENRKRLQRELENTSKTAKKKKRRF